MRSLIIAIQNIIEIDRLPKYTHNDDDITEISSSFTSNSTTTTITDNEVNRDENISIVPV